MADLLEFTETGTGLEFAVPTNHIVAIRQKTATVSILEVKSRLTSSNQYYDVDLDIAADLFPVSPGPVTTELREVEFSDGVVGALVNARVINAYDGTDSLEVIYDAGGSSPDKFLLAGTLAQFLA